MFGDLFKVPKTSSRVLLV